MDFGPTGVVTFPLWVGRCVVTNVGHAPVQIVREAKRLRKQDIVGDTSDQSPIEESDPPANRYQRQHTGLENPSTG